jgi:hypothetical protein
MDHAQVGGPYSDGTTLWGPVCNCYGPPHRHGVSSNTSPAVRAADTRDGGRP